MRRASIARRLAVGLTLMTAVLWLCAAAIAGLVLQHELEGAFDESLEQSAYRLLPLAMHRLREPHEEEQLEIPRIEKDEGYFAYVVTEPDGTPVARGADVPPEVAPIDVPEGYSYAAERRAFALTDPTSGYRIVVFEQTAHRTAALMQSFAGLIWPLIALVPLIVAGIWFAVRIAMRPVERLASSIWQRDRFNLAPLDGSENQLQELVPIVTAVSSLIERLREARDAERAFAASSAHELRTPIAGALAQVQQLKLELDSAAGPRLTEVENTLRHLSALSEKLLQLARLESGFAKSDIVVDLVPIARLVIGDIDRMSQYAGRIVLHVNSGLSAAIDSDAFAIALRNLAENALIHGKGPVEVTIEGNSQLTIKNDAPTVKPELLAGLAKPFARGHTDAAGTGLGLSIVSTILHQAGGTLELYSPARGRNSGFEAVMSFSPPSEAAQSS